VLPPKGKKIVEEGSPSISISPSKEERKKRGGKGISLTKTQGRRKYPSDRCEGERERGTLPVLYKSWKRGKERGKGREFVKGPGALDGGWGGYMAMKRRKRKKKKGEIYVTPSSSRKGKEERGERIVHTATGTW